MANERNYIGLTVKKMKPTKSHKPAIWEGILGTVYAVNKAGKVKYFDYNYEAAIEYAELDYSDLRAYKTDRGYNFGSYYAPEGPSKGQLVLWTK